MPLTLKEAFERNEAFGANLHDSDSQQRAQCKINYPKFDLTFSFYNFHGKNFGIWLFTELFTLFTLVRSCFITHTTFIEGPKSLLTHVHDSRRHKSLENFPTYENSQGKEMLLAKLYKNNPKSGKVQVQADFQTELSQRAIFQT